LAREAMSANVRRISESLSIRIQIRRGDKIRMRQHIDSLHDHFVDLEALIGWAHAENRDGAQ